MTTDQPQDRHDLRDHSDRLIEEIEAIKALEVEKRGHEISTPEFHRLAEAIVEKSRDIFRLAAEEDLIGEVIEEPQGVSIDEVRPER